ncbi:MAG TPA: hypothetical protein GXX51_00615 [Firmicutes bacterium]|nr:hypothetical protein [Bacillota bacterium]
MSDWYRWERKDKGDVILLEPWIPETAMENEDKTTPRICVAPSPEEAFAALRNSAPKDISFLVLYKLIDPVPIYRPTREQVPDVHKTNEHWILCPAKFRKIDISGIIGLEVLR